MLLDASRKASFSAPVSLRRCLSIASSRDRLPDAVAVVEVPCETCVEDACASCAVHDEGCVALEITGFGRKKLGSSLSRLRILNGKPAADMLNLTPRVLKCWKMNEAKQIQFAQLLAHCPARESWHAEATPLLKPPYELANQ
jgi:hypothetical protein